ncbi:MAG: membrane spanning protein in TolA-TolQ-TolR complex [uncultured bacterium]|nr:MAG: membrane spanning protein in TolA-TolQ-TolR complex [uncultured bacterium]
MQLLNQRSARRSMSSEMNVVPFIDVMLVLLVIFMITTPLLTQGVKIDLPKTEAKAVPPDQKEPLIVTVDANGNFYLNIASKPNEPLTARVLGHTVSTELSNEASSTEQRPVLVRGDKNANYGKVVEAMSLLQQAGAKSVGLITESPPVPAGS